MYHQIEWYFYTGIPCDAPPAGTNADVTSGSFVYEDIAFYECWTGYEYKNGDYSITCDATGNNVPGFWIGTPLNCKCEYRWSSACMSVSYL